jgi:hypothetical protein
VDGIYRFIFKSHAAERRMGGESSKFTYYLG